MSLACYVCGKWPASYSSLFEAMICLRCHHLCFHPDDPVDVTDDEVPVGIGD